MNREKKILELAKLFCELPKDKQKSVLKFMELLKEIEGLPLEEQQKIIDEKKNDDDIIELFEIYKSTLS